MMLIVTRKPGESVHIGEDIIVKILSVAGQNVRVGIDAPRDVPVHREEVKQRIEKEKLTGDAEET